MRLSETKGLEIAFPSILVQYFHGPVVVKLWTLHLLGLGFFPFTHPTFL